MGPWTGWGKDFSVRQQSGQRRQAHRWLLYYLYGMERVGRMSGQRFFGRARLVSRRGSEMLRYDWYAKGAGDARPAVALTSGVGIDIENDAADRHVALPCCSSRKAAGRW